MPIFLERLSIFAHCASTTLAITRRHEPARLASTPPRTSTTRSEPQPVRCDTPLPILIDRLAPTSQARPTPRFIDKPSCRTSYLDDHAIPCVARRLLLPSRACATCLPSPCHHDVSARLGLRLTLLTVSASTPHLDPTDLSPPFRYSLRRLSKPALVMPTRRIMLKQRPLTTRPIPGQTDYPPLPHAERLPASIPIPSARLPVPTQSATTCHTSLRHHESGRRLESTQPATTERQHIESTRQV
jgi:hypothetical protein